MYCLRVCPSCGWCVASSLAALRGALRQIRRGRPMPGSAPRHPFAVVTHRTLVSHPSHPLSSLLCVAASRPRLAPASSPNSPRTAAWGAAAATMTRTPAAHRSRHQVVAYTPLSLALLVSVVSVCLVSLPSPVASLQLWSSQHEWATPPQPHGHTHTHTSGGGEKTRRGRATACACVCLRLATRVMSGVRL